MYVIIAGTSQPLKLYIRLSAKIQIVDENIVFLDRFSGFQEDRFSRRPSVSAGFKNLLDDCLGPSQSRFNRLEDIFISNVLPQPTPLECIFRLLLHAG